MKLSEGSSSPAPRPSGQSPGKQRKKYDSGSRGREKTRGGEGQGNGRSSWDPSNSRVCWNCDEVTNNHYANTCPKPQKKKDDPNRLVTLYPRGRCLSSSRERGGASQGSETYRMMKGSFGRKPWLAQNKQPGPEGTPAKNEESDEEGLVEDEEDKNKNEKSQPMVDR